MSNVMTRRTALTSTASAAIIMAAGGAAAMIPTTRGEVERHWDDRRAAYREFEADDLTFTDPCRERAYWDRIDTAEIAILASTIRTRRTAELQLWVAWAHTKESSSAVEILVREGDYEGLSKIRSELDWHEKMLLTAIGTLRGEA